MVNHDYAKFFNAIRSKNLSLVAKACQRVDWDVFYTHQEAIKPWDKGLLYLIFPSNSSITCYDYRKDRESGFHQDVLRTMIGFGYQPHRDIDMARDFLFSSYRQAFEDFSQTLFSFEDEHKQVVFSFLNTSKTWGELEADALKTLMKDLTNVMVDEKPLLYHFWNNALSRFKPQTTFTSPSLFASSLQLQQDVDLRTHGNDVLSLMQDFLDLNQKRINLKHYVIPASDDLMLKLEGHITDFKNHLELIKSVDKARMNKQPRARKI